MGFNLDMTIQVTSILVMSALVFGVGAFLCFGAMNYCKQMHLRRHPEDYIPDKEPTETTAEEQRNDE